VSNAVNFSPSGGSVVLRGVEIGLDSDIGVGFVDDCCRFCEGLVTEDQIKSKYKLNDNAWSQLGDNEPLQQAVQRARERRVRNGDAARQKAQFLFLAAPDVLGGRTTSWPRRAAVSKRQRSFAKSRWGGRKPRRQRASNSSFGSIYPPRPMEAK